MRYFAVAMVCLAFLAGCVDEPEIRPPIPDAGTSVEIPRADVLFELVWDSRDASDGDDVIDPDASPDSPDGDGATPPAEGPEPTGPEVASEYPTCGWTLPELNDPTGENHHREDLSGQDLSGKDLRNADFVGADLTGANLSNTDLRCADFRGANLTNVNLAGTKLEGAWFAGATTTGLKADDAQWARTDVGRKKVGDWPKYVKTREGPFMTRTRNSSFMPMDDTLEMWQNEVLRLVNVYREQLGLSPLLLDPDLSLLAADHNAYQKQMGNISHDNFDKRAGKAGYLFCGENVGTSRQISVNDFRHWNASPGHDETYRVPGFTHVGIHYADGYATFFACGGGPSFPTP